MLRVFGWLALLASLTVPRTPRLSWADRAVQLARRGSRSAVCGLSGSKNVAMVLDQRFQAAVSYSLRSPPRIGRRRIPP